MAEAAKKRKRRKKGIIAMNAYQYQGAFRDRPRQEIHR